ncbi:VOC family protein [Allorhodopirellula heiligendammensis]|uniref:Glyoxalase-like domain protein n=1 Tax=Allorhodopirellula heiligendammensis TaxID=2714739 RepID=A0A5C6C5Z4_9BACT|nr:VOC family protein [Allorhodopirellula heiligendammensis]TWU19578.1 Glyoxalase-like domain protein [Allorhodopirellula heiligendammensis]|tara:strand:- start:1152 stop:1553 length:402 start_codon:yes stop_codon:yes gene_type:complete
MQPNPVCWFEIYVDDLERATKFYETVLDTKLEKLDSPVESLEMMAFPMSMESPGASGALCRMDGIKCGGGSTIVYFNTKDCGVEASRIEAAGGKVHMPKTPIGQYGFIALGVDTEGNVFGLHSSNGVPCPEGT